MATVWKTAVAKASRILFGLTNRLTNGVAHVLTHGLAYRMTFREVFGKA